MASCRIKNSAVFSLMGFVVFILVFFIVYWLVLCPSIWKYYYNYNVQVQGVTAWAYVWVYCYWFVAISLLVIAVLVSFSFCRVDDEVEIIDIDKLKPPVDRRNQKRESPETYIPFTSYLKSIQPTRVNGQQNQFTNSGFSSGEVDLVSTVVQPPMSSLPGSYQPREDWEDMEAMATWQSTPQSTAKQATARDSVSANEPEWEDEVPWPTRQRVGREILSSDLDPEDSTTVEDMEAFTSYLHLVSGEEPSVPGNDKHVDSRYADKSTLIVKDK